MRGFFLLLFFMYFLPEQQNQISDALMGWELLHGKKPEFHMDSICTKCVTFDSDELWLTCAPLQVVALQPFPAGCQDEKCPFRQKEVLFPAPSLPS